MCPLGPLPRLETGSIRRARKGCPAVGLDRSSSAVIAISLSVTTLGACMSMRPSRIEPAPTVSHLVAACVRE